MAADRAFGLQMHVRQNSEELGDFLKDLDRWEDDIKRKDEGLQSAKDNNKTNLPPVRNRGKKKKPKKRRDETNDKQPENTKSQTRISSYDYRSWDKLDVDKMIGEIETKEEMETVTSSEDEDEDDEQVEEERRLQKSLLEKDKGNDLFKVGRYEEAINCYTTAIQLDPSNAVLPANRAIALLKVNRYGAAEADCDLAIALDSTYTKAYLRRGKARLHLDKLPESLSDYEHALELEPSNKQAQQEISNIQKKLGIKEPSSENSSDRESVKQKKPMKRVIIEEIGSDSEEDKRPSEQSEIHMSSETSRRTNEIHFRASKGEETAVVLTDETSRPSSDANALYGQNIIGNNNHEDKSTVKGMPQRTQKVFNIPKTSMQLQADWKLLRNKPSELFEYLKKICPESYPKLFQQSVDSDMLTTILGTFHDFYIPAQLPLLDELKCLAKVKRFGMALMFLSAHDRSVLEDLFSYARQCPGSACGESEFMALKKKYGL